jgi:hypothetical protein
VEAHRLHPFFERGTDVDVVLDLMIHDLEICLHYIKGGWASVDAVGYRSCPTRWTSPMYALPSKADVWPTSPPAG